MSEVLEIPDRFSRREFLRLSASSLLSLAVPVHWTGPQTELSDGLLGRVSSPTLTVFQQPYFGSEKVKTFWRDDVLELEGALIGDRVPEHNRVWYEINGLGYAHSGSIQPVRNDPNEPLPAIAPSGQLMEVTVPFVDVHWRPREDAEKVYRFYYGTTHWVTGVSRDVKLRKWYRIADDKWVYTYYAPADAFRPIGRQELTPISPEVPLEEKLIRVDLKGQWMECLEGGTPVFATKISSGRKFGEDFYWTPEGSFITFRKRGSRHMAAGNLASGYDLPGVPWVSYITENGVAFHGTYWHNDYGIPRSHGCLNMTIEAAKWLFRWTLPEVPLSEQEVWVSYGTPVRIHT